MNSCQIYSRWTLIQLGRLTAQTNKAAHQPKSPQHVLISPLSDPAKTSGSFSIQLPMALTLAIFVHMSSKVGRNFNLIAKLYF
jgi:hypothetical protein